MVTNSRSWQSRSKLAEALAQLMTDYQMRKSKFIKYVPTEQELKEAMKLYMFILEEVDENDPGALKMIELINSVSTVPETQIQFVGFMDEILRKYPSGQVPTQFLMDIAEKWDVLDYIMEDRLRSLGIRIG